MDLRIKATISGLKPKEGAMTITQLKDFLISKGYNVDNKTVSVAELKKLLNEYVLSKEAKRVQKQENTPPEFRDIVAKVRTDEDLKICYLDKLFLRSMAATQSLIVETGGSIDLTLDGQFERAMYGIGGTSSLNYDNIIDFEIMYHTHPTRTGIICDIMSSMDIIAAILNKDKQLLLVFAHDAIYSIYINRKYSESAQNTLVLKLASLIPSCLYSLEKFEQMCEIFKKTGIYLIRHSTNKNSLITLENWPDRLPMYLLPVESLKVLKKSVQYIRSLCYERELIKNHYDNKQVLRIIRELEAQTPLTRGNIIAILNNNGILDSEASKLADSIISDCIL